MTIQIESTAGIDVPTFDIMVDYDDVITPWADVVHNQCELLGLTNGKAYASWHMWEDYGCTKEEWENAVIAATTNGLYTDTEPLPGAVDAINSLLWRGHRVHIVTARGFMANGRQIRLWTAEALAKFGIGHSTLMFSKDKVKVQRKLGVEFDYAIDDGVHNYEALDAAGIRVWMHSQPHNAAYEAERRIGSLWEFAQMIHRDQTISASLIHDAMEAV
jgi:hypothetical protein